MNAVQIIKKHGGEVVRRYDLINNWGYYVTYKGIEYDVRRWANCYGSDCGWDVMSRSAEQDGDWVDALKAELNDCKQNDEW